MARRKPPEQGKTRTRQHVIGDLGVNAVERQVLLRGYTLTRVVSDYGYDATISVFDDVGVLRPGWLFSQIKAIESVQRLRADDSIVFRLERADVQMWLAEAMPVILCVYDVGADTVYWLYVQRYFESLPGFNLFALGQTTTVHIPPTHRLTADAVGRLGADLDRLQRQIQENLDHE